MKNEPFVIERIYNAPIEKVWQALTNKDEMKRWYFELEDFKPEVGFEFTFTGGEPGGQQFLHLCKVTEVNPGQKITYSWKYDGYEGISYVSFELFKEENKTRLKLTHQGLETFPAIQAFAKTNFVAGWTEILGTTLKKYLEN
jgi:uncharacterized protein YndB with AHSA1/START domain